MLAEELLDVWVGLSLTIDNVRLVSCSEISYNEMMVCHMLIRQEKENPEQFLTATDLTERLNMYKSQMAGVLAGLEKRGLIVRTRSARDKRVIYVQGTEKMYQVYAGVHERMLRIVQSVTDACGEEEIRALIATCRHVLDTVQLDDKKGEKQWQSE